MERVTFLVEETNERLSCMLNPETVVMKRSTGVRPRESLSGIISGNEKGDNPLLFTGAGYTTLELDLVFDISLAGSSVQSHDVRDLTKPIWNLSENRQRSKGMYHPAICRFIWGKSWNILAVISTIAERLESFTSEGIPGRSWVRLELIRMQDQPQPAFDEDSIWPDLNNKTTTPFGNGFNSNQMTRFQLLDTKLNRDNFKDNSEIQNNSYERIDLIANRLKGSTSFWRDISLEFELDNPLQWINKQLENHHSDSKQQEIDQ